MAWLLCTKRERHCWLLEMRLGEHRTGLDILEKRSGFSAKKMKVLIFLDDTGKSPFAIVPKGLRLLAEACV